MKRYLLLLAILPGCAASHNTMADTPPANAPVAQQQVGQGVSFISQAAVPGAQVLLMALIIWLSHRREMRRLGNDSVNKSWGFYSKELQKGVATDGETKAVRER